MERSGVEPPNLDDFQWGNVMDDLEASARDLLSQHLELAIAADELRPGSRGWRAHQAEIAREFLLDPHADLHGQSLLAAIRAQRARAWARGAGVSRRNEPRAELLEPLLPEISAGPPADAAHPLPAVTWLLERAACGLALTAAGYLSVALVREAAERFGLESYGSARRETDVPALAELHDLIVDMGVVRKRKNELRLTKAASALPDDPDALWQTVAGALAAREGFASAVAELTLAVLLGGGPEDDHEAQLAVVLAEDGWRDQVTGLPPSREGLIAHYYAVVRRLRALGGLEGERWYGRSIELSSVGRALALEALRKRATGPLNSI